MRLFIAITASIVMLSIDHITPRLKPLRAALSLLVDPVKYLVDLPTEATAKVTDSVKSYSSLQTENRMLKKTQAVDQMRLLKYEALEKENIRLRALLDSSYQLGEQVLITELLSIRVSPNYENIVVVNKGSRFGIHEQQPVLDANGVVGQVFRALPLSSEIMLITDPNHAIPVEVNRNGLLTIAVGSGELNRLNLPFLPDNADIRPGDLLITSGLGGVFPQGYPVAVVDPFTPPANKQVTATPKAALDRNRELMIVWSNSKQVLLTPNQEHKQPSAQEQKSDE